ncbi:hypothetical protein QLX08_007142 [Tetragonisca angustula]|uniref:Uncharacterized protein n=2 Tax=Tetragonisca angustula TaxID=166442 RepID=A0AAW0ZSL7_9HYME
MRVPPFDKRRSVIYSDSWLRKRFAQLHFSYSFSWILCQTLSNVFFLDGGWELSRKSIFETMSSVLLVILAIIGTYANPVFRSNDSINKIDQDTPKEGNIANESSSVFEQVIAQSSDASTTSKPSLLTWFLVPLTQNLQVNPQTLQNRVTQLKEALGNLGFRNPNEISKGKQLNNANNLLQVTSATDSGFYTDRLEPAGFLGGNGWLANKGGILGGPGAILSTGSLLTDYPTAYKKK